MLKKNYEFKNVLTKGKKFSGQYLNLFVMKNGFNYNLLGLAVSSKVGKAVQRVKIKRLLRENYQNIEENLKKGYSLVFLVKKKEDISNLNFQSIKTDVNNILEKANIIVKE